MMKAIKINRHRGIMRKLVPAMAALLLLAPANPAAQARDANRLTGLREGKIFIRVDQAPAEMSVKYKSIYGWDEPILLFDPAGKLLAADRFGHDGSGSRTYNLNRGPGIYVLLLKPSYVYTVETSAAKMVFAPPSRTFGFYRTITDPPLYFHMPPESPPDPALLFANIHKCKGRDTRLAVYDPQGALVAEHHKPGIETDECYRRLTELNLSQLEQSQRQEDFVIDYMPPDLGETRVAISNAAPGYWKIQFGATSPWPYKAAVWLYGVPNFFAGHGKYWFEPAFPARAVTATLRVGDHLDQRPFLGVVGHMGAPNSTDAKILKGLGQSGDKLFLWQDKMMPAHEPFQFPHRERFDPAHAVFSLVVFRKEAERMVDQPVMTRLLNWGLWARKSAEAMLTDVGRHPDTFAFQVLNEPNLNMGVAEYIRIFRACARAVKKYPATAPVQFAGPALGSSEEQDVVDWEWIRQLLNRADDLVDVICWNNYRIKNLEDTFLFAEALEETVNIIREEDRDGQMEKIIIGATNREGGLAPDQIFNSWDAALWWASTLAQVINTGQLTGINYYNVMDEGHGRNKGLLDQAYTPKPQAFVHREFSKLLAAGNPSKVISDHPALEAVACRKADGLELILLNKGWHRLTVNLEIPHKKIGTYTVQRLETDGRPGADLSRRPLTINPEEILLVSIP